MMKIFLIAFFSMIAGISFGQATDTLDNGIVIHGDFRLGMVKKQEVKQNIEFLKSRSKRIKGYRLMVLNTRDKDYAFKIRTELLQNFPDQKPYMWYANPYIRIKFGDFATKDEAKEYQEKVSAMMGGAKIYLLNETVDLRPGKDWDPETVRNLVLDLD